MASASSSSNTSWMPAPGRHRVEIGSSLARALKSRKLLNSNGGVEVPPVASKRSHLPDKDFYTFRYYHKPPSVDPKKPGMIEFRKKDVTLELPSVQAGESAMFRGQESPLNKHECVLIFDEDTGTFTLEKLDACVQLTSDRNLPSIIPRNASPAPSNSARGPSNAYNNDSNNIDQDILDLVGGDSAPAPAPSTSSLKKSNKPSAPPPPRKKEEEEEGEEGEAEEEDDFPTPPNRKRPVSPVRPAPALSSKPTSRPIKPLPKSVPKPTAAGSTAASTSSSSASSRLPAPPVEAALPPRPKSSVPLPGIKARSQQQQKQPPTQRLPHAATPVAKDEDKDEEEIPLVKPVPPVKLGKPAKKLQSSHQPPPPPPPPRSPAPLALPGSSSVLPTLPSALPGSRPVGGKAQARGGVPPVVAASHANAPPPPVQAPVEVQSDSDDEWDEVSTGIAGAGGPAQDELSMLEEEIFGDAASTSGVGGNDGETGMTMNEEDDFDFHRQLEMEMADIAADNEDGEGELDEDGDEDDDLFTEPAEMHQVPEGDGPISLNELAGGGGMNLSGLSDDDEYSSSDDSDDD